MSDILHEEISERTIGTYSLAKTKRRTDRQSYRRNTILTATRELFGEFGASNVTVRKIAERSGTTPPTIYNLIGSRDNVLEKALMQSLVKCIKIAPHVAQLRDINPILALADIFWMASKADPAYARNQINFNIKNIEGQRISKLFIEDTVKAIASWIPALCGQAGMSRTMTACVIAETIEGQFRMAAVDWVNGQASLATFRRRLAAGAVANLLYFARPAEVNRMNRWLEFLH